MPVLPIRDGDDPADAFDADDVHLDPARVEAWRREVLRIALIRDGRERLAEARRAVHDFFGPWP